MVHYPCNSYADFEEKSPTPSLLFKIVILDLAILVQTEDRSPTPFCTRPVRRYHPDKIRMFSKHFLFV